MVVWCLTNQAVTSQLTTTTEDAVLCDLSDLYCTKQSNHILVRNSEFVAKLGTGINEML